MDVLFQVLKLLPPRLTGKWREYSRFIQRTVNHPSLIHLEAWLQERLMAMKDPYTPAPVVSRNKTPGTKDILSYTTTVRCGCILCNSEHLSRNVASS